MTSNLRLRAPAAVLATGLRRSLDLGALVALLAFVVPAAHAEGGRLTSELKVQIVAKDTDGKETLRPADAVKPGDVLQYTAVYQNGSLKPVEGLVANLPIPAGTEWVAASAQPAAITASLDGKTYAPLPLTRRVLNPAGQWVVEPVPVAEYRHLRWSERPLAPGASYSTTTRVRVIASSAAVTATAAPK